MTVDPNGNATGYQYDHQNRLIREVYADGTDRRFTYNDVGTLATDKDPRGVVKSYEYDLLERRTAMTVSGNLPPGVGQTTFAAWDYDGLGRVTKAEDNDSLVETWFDSLSRAVKEEQQILTGTPRTSAGGSMTGAVTGAMLRGYDGVGNLIRQTYPHDSYQLDRRYDEVNRLAAVREGNNASAPVIAKFTHVGMGSRRVSRDYVVSGTIEMRQRMAYDDDRRVVRLENATVSGGTETRLGRDGLSFSYVWDRENHRRSERHLPATAMSVPVTLDVSGGVLPNSSAQMLAGSGSFYRYDSAYRLIHDERDVADGTLDGPGSSRRSFLAILTAGSVVLVERRPTGS